MALYKTRVKNSIYKIPYLKFLSIFLLFLLAFGERVLFDLGPNLELVTMVLILSSFYFGTKTSFWLTFSVMILSDLVIGNSNIFIFTWSGFLIPALFARIFYLNSKLIPKLLMGTLAGINSIGFFFIWTNLGVWLLSGMYPKNTEGLMMSYINALPFLRSQAISTLIFVPLGIIVVEFAIYFAKKFNLEKRLNFIFNLR